MVPLSSSFHSHSPTLRPSHPNPKPFEFPRLATQRPGGKKKKINQRLIKNFFVHQRCTQLIQRFLKLICHMGSSKDNEKILNYNDVLLRRSDLNILSGPYFLNDRIIEFYFSYLASCHPSEDILLVPPSISFWLTNCPDPESLKDFTEPLKLPDKKLIIFVVNNNEDVTMAEGGTHWSLLAYERSTNTFVHHDSMAGSNSLHAKRLWKALLRFIDSSGSDSDGRYLEYSATPQQRNGYDCGLYVLAIVKVICQWHESVCSQDRVALWFSTLKEQVVPSAVAEMRNKILSLIRDLMLKN